jgi:hypothetical protein
MEDKSTYQLETRREKGMSTANADEIHSDKKKVCEYGEHG